MVLFKTEKDIGVWLEKLADYCRSQTDMDYYDFFEFDAFLKFGWQSFRKKIN